MKLKCAILITLSCLFLCSCANTVAGSGTSDDNTSSSVSAEAVTDEGQNTEQVPTELEPHELSRALSEEWLKRWDSLSEQYEMSFPQASVFCAQLSEQRTLAAVIFPSYKSNRGVFYLCDENGVTEIGELGCGWEFEVLESDNGALLHITTKLAGSAADGRLETDDIYYTIDRDGLSCVLNMGKMDFGGETVQFFEYDESYNTTELSEGEYNNAISELIGDYLTIKKIDLDKNDDYQNDDHIPFLEEDGLAEYIAAEILSARHSATDAAEAPAQTVTGEPESSSVIVSETNQEYTNENIACSPIDQNLDCEAILLEKAEALSRLMTDYLSMDESKLAYDIGEPLNIETSEIQQLITDFKEFSYSYILCKDVRFWVSSNNFITTESINENGEKYELKWYKVTDGDITTYQQLTDALSNLCTDEMVDSIRYSLENSYSEKDNSLYLSENSGHDGGVMGSDIIYIHSLEPVANDIVTVNMISYGDLDYWGYETINEAIELHSLQIKMVNGQWKIDQCDIKILGYIAWLYNSEYDNI